MKRIFKLGLIAILSLVAASCRADDVPKYIRYDLVAYDFWPVFIFYRTTNHRHGASNQYKLAASNGGWISSVGSAPIRNSSNRDDQFDSLEFDFIWREEETQRVYQARIEVALSDLKPDPISPEMGTLIFRFARGGDLQAVTYEPSMQPGAVPPIEIAHVCGSRTEISDQVKMQEMDRLSDYWKANDADYSTAPGNVPSRCE